MGPVSTILGPVPLAGASTPSVAAANHAATARSSSAIANLAGSVAAEGLTGEATRPVDAAGLLALQQQRFRSFKDEVALAAKRKLIPGVTEEDQDEYEEHPPPRDGRGEDGRGGDADEAADDGRPAYGGVGAVLGGLGTDAPVDAEPELAGDAEEEARRRRVQDAAASYGEQQSPPAGGTVSVLG